MALSLILQCLSVMVVLTEARPEPPLPLYNYAVPNLEQNFVSRAKSSQAYLPPSTFLRTSEQSQSSAVLPPSRDYGSPISAFRSQSEPTLSIQKHIYVHVAPPDVEEQTAQQLQQQRVPQRKHYKIIFVKVPSYPTRAQYVEQQQEVQQEKTLIYVLVKKPEDPIPVRQSDVASAPLNKPEVYFIKYKSRSQQAVENVIPEDKEAVLVENPNRQSQGYRYDRPGGILN